MEELEEVFVENEPVEPDLVCPICTNPLLDPVLEPGCEQLLCRRCLTQCLQSSPLCPLCRETTSIDIVGRPPRFITTKLNSIKVVCPLCAGPFERGSLAQHKAQCPQPCVHGCGESIAPLKLNEHDVVCWAKCEPCVAAHVGCTWTGQRREKSEHVKTCQTVALQPILLRLQGLEERMAKVEEGLAVLPEVFSMMQFLRKAMSVENDLTDSTFLQGQDFSGKDLSGRNFQGATLTNTNFANTNLTNANFANTNLTNADLTNANFTKANLSGANFTNANLSGALNLPKDLTKVNLSGANLTNVDLSGAKLAKGSYHDLTDLTNVNLSGANLTKADFGYANLAGANFTKANLTDAILGWVDVTGANFTDAKMRQMRLYLAQGKEEGVRTSACSACGQTGFFGCLHTSGHCWLPPLPSQKIYCPRNSSHTPRVYVCPCGVQNVSCGCGYSGKPGREEDRSCNLKMHSHFW